MTPEPYVLVSTWTVAAPPDRVWAVFDAFVDDADPFAWWPDLVVDRRDGDVLHVATRSGLGYRLRFRLHSLRTRPATSIGFDASGDLNGTGDVELAPDEQGGTHVRITWTVAPARRWMRWTTPVLRPLYAAAHRRVMRRGERALSAWLA
ncbi:SRPBCC family protein [Aeromicrobium alkaliterrae]|uniref:Polyketide cyclase n=1 Tax=Aeromicrobium alkaliterrae TaxID=302168 RepID=A0ABN2JKN0_9ACTN